MCDKCGSKYGHKPWCPDLGEPTDERVSRTPESAGSVSQRLIEAEDILSDLSTGYWISVLDDADAPVNVKMGQRVLNYWKKQNDPGQPRREET